MPGLETGKLPCRVVIEKDEDEDCDNVIFVFKDKATAFKYCSFFPPAFYNWISFEGYRDAFMCKRTTIH